MKNLKLGFAAIAIAACTSVFAAETAVEEPVDESQGIGAIGWTPVQVGILAPISIPWGMDWDVKGFDLDIFYMETVKFQGLGISGVAARTRDRMDGILISGLCTWNDSDARGVELTLGANLGFGDFYGLGIAGFGLRNVMEGCDFNFVGSYQKSFTGWQTAGICNFAYEDCTGASLALGLNMAKVMTGAQIGGINYTDELHGAQIGLVNIAHECAWGFQIGLINFIFDNRVKVLPIFNCYFGGGEE